MIRGERPIKLGDSWFSAKSIEVEHFSYLYWGRALVEQGGVRAYRLFRNSEYNVRYLE